ncbi:hypothetical protein M2480_001997 [Parabacteroides sp. PFB2-12]|uniref:BF3164 family lipoprotein n=1 Tax=unclassified Parabacteroides TaxID=2649774 RepID=UPI002475C809|nr:MULTISPECIES: BF3164 family lipoprotein [unclassified Parabacteroides]MDH6342977.1 hypothetical protein [Parabacteroides sp. PM6-13]MDH6391008.1 hypothetical protein [Parabacteroides sp. PFB2-12]
MRNRNTIIPFVCLFLLLIGCKPKELERISLEAIPLQALTMERLVRVPGQFPPRPSMLTDDIILLTHPISSSFMGVYQLGDSAVSRHKLKKKGDHIPVPNSQIDTTFQLFNQHTLATYQVQNGTLTLTDFVRFTFARDKSPEQVVTLNDDLYACLGSYLGGLFGLCKRKKKEMRYTGAFPTEDMALRRLLHSNSSGRMDKQGDQIVYANRSVGYIAAFTYSFGRLRKQWDKQLTDYVYQTKEGHITFDPDEHRSGFSDIHITDRHIYTLYWGQTRSMGLEVPNSIVVFNRDGEPVSRFSLPDQMTFIAVDSREEYLYATYSPLMNECYLVRFKLP